MPAVGGRATVPVLVLRDELVEVVEALVVAHVGHHVPGGGDNHVGALVLEAAHRGALLRRRRRIERVHLDDPAEAVGLVFVAGVAGVEARVVEFPLAGGRRAGQPVAPVAGGRAGGDEVAVEVFLAGEDGAPRRGAAGAVAEGPADGAAGGVGHGAHQRGPGHGSGELVGGVRQVAPVEPGALDVGPRLVLVLAFEFDDGQAVGGAADGPCFGGRQGCREHDRLVRVLVVGEQHGAAVLRAFQRQDVRVVVVVAELPGLGGRGLGVEVEVRGVVEERVAPADDRLPAEALRDGDGVDGGVHRCDRRERQLGLPEAVLRGRGQTRAAVGHGGSGRPQSAAERDRERARGPETQGGAAGDAGGGDVAEVAVGAGVADRAGAGVVALQRAGDGAALAFGVAEHGQEAELAGGVRHGEATFSGGRTFPVTLPADTYRETSPR